MKLGFGARVVMILIVAGEAVITFLTVAVAGVPVGWAVASFVVAGVLTAGYFWAFTRTGTNERGE